MLFHDNFFPYYYYLVSMGEEQISPFPNWFITDGIAFGVNDSMQRGIVLKDKKQICILRDVFRKKLGMCKPLVVHSELTEYVHDVNSMMNAGYVIRNYYIEQSPCLLHLIPTNILKDQLIGEEAQLHAGRCSYHPVDVEPSGVPAFTSVCQHTARRHSCSYSRQSCRFQEIPSILHNKIIYLSTLCILLARR